MYASIYSIQIDSFYQTGQSFPISGFLDYRAEWIDELYQYKLDMVMSDDDKFLFVSDM